MEDLLLWHTVFLDCVLESLDVLHQLEIGAFLLDFLHRARLDLVDEIAEDHAVFEYVLKFTGRHRFTKHVEDPFEDLLFQFLVAGLVCVREEIVSVSEISRYKSIISYMGGSCLLVLQLLFDVAKLAEAI